MRWAAISAAALALAGCQQFDYETPVKGELRDPGSAEFSDVEVNGKIACGFVNSRNGFGGYAGRVPFVVQSSQATVITEPGPDKMQLIYDRCQNQFVSKAITWSSEQISERLKALN